MSVHRAAALILAAVVACSPARALAQTQPDPAIWRTLLERLSPAPFVSVRLADGTAFKGTVVSVGDADFTIQPRTRIPVAVRTVRFEDVAALEPQKRPMSAGRKVITGIGIGVATYMLLVVIALSSGFD